MKKYFPELDTVSDILDSFPYPQVQSIAPAIHIYNDQYTNVFTKQHAIGGD